VGQYRDDVATAVGGGIDPRVQPGHAQQLRNSGGVLGRDCGATYCRISSTAITRAVPVAVLNSSTAAGRDRECLSVVCGFQP
jgi:hypothetical protein